MYRITDEIVSRSDGTSTGVNVIRHDHVREHEEAVTPATELQDVAKERGDCVVCEDRASALDDSRDEVRPVLFVIALPSSHGDSGQAEGPACRILRVRPG